METGIGDDFSDGMQQEVTDIEGIDGIGTQAQAHAPQDMPPQEPTQDIANVLEELLKLESEKSKGIVLDCIGSDGKSFLKLYEEFMKNKQEQDNINYLEKLEKRLAGIDEKIQKIFVTGNYEEHYMLHEKAIVYVAGKLKAKTRESVAKKVNAWVGAREAEKAMRKIESKIRFYEKKYSREKGREDEYSTEIEGIEGRLRNDKFELDILSKSILQIEGEMKRSDEVTAETEKMSRDLKRLQGRQHSAARRINKDSAIFSWKESFYMNMNLTKDESEHVLEQLKNHYEILSSMMNDYRKCGIAVELKEGRILMRDMRKTQEDLKKIQDEFSGALVEGARMRGCPPDSLPVYPNKMYKDARDVMDKMRREDCLKAYQNLDNIFSSKCSKPG